MKILYVGMGSWSGQKLIDALRQLDHTVKTFYYRDYKQEMNFRLKNTIESFEPDMLFMFKCESVDPEIIKLYRRGGIKTVFYTFDDPQCVLRVPAVRNVGCACEYVLTCCESVFNIYEKAGSKPVLIYIGYDKRNILQTPLTSDDINTYRCDASFAGTNYEHTNPTRRQIVNALFEEGMHVRVWGNNWPKDMKVEYCGVLRNEIDLTKAVSASKININNFYMKGRKYLNQRYFEIIAAKSLHLCYKQEGIEDFLQDDKEIVYWKTLEELVDKAKYYLAHESERKDICEAAYQKAEALGFSTFEQMKKALKFVKDN